MSADVIKAIGVTAVLTRAELSKEAIQVMVMDLAGYPEPAVLAALARCRKELDRPLTLKAVLDRLNEADGRLTANEAWSAVLDAQDEGATVVWCDEMRTAFAAARPVLEAGDKVGARMAFIAAYERLVLDARVAGRPARWEVSAGWDPARREQVLLKAVEFGRLSAKQAQRYLPAPSDAGPVVAALLGGPGAVAQLPAPASGQEVDFEEVKRRVAGLKAVLAAANQRKADKRRAEQEDRQREREQFDASRKAALDAVAAGVEAHG